MKMVALIPARAGSKRIPGKNMRRIGGHRLLHWAIAAAQESGCFSRVVVSTDSDDAGGLALRAGAYYLPRWAPVDDDQPDIVWVREALQHFESVKDPFDAFAILRPTSPFRTADTIRRAYARFQTQEVHSMRAVQIVSEHPGKMWQWGGEGHAITPLIHDGWPTSYGAEFRPGKTPWHSMPTQSLPTVFVQNASLEMAWSWVVPAFGTISGTKVAPFFTEGYEGFDINTPDDWREAERLIQEGKVALPTLARV